MQAIVTRYLCPTNHHGSRISVSCDAGQRVYPWDQALDVEANHAAAAERLARELGWLDGRRLVGGSLPKGASHAYAFVLVKH